MKDDLTMAVSLISLMAIYAFGFFGWPYMPKSIPILYNLYYICMASVVYGMSLVIFLLAKGTKTKIISCIWLGISSAILYNELFLDPTNYTWWSFGLIVVVSLNMWLSVSIIERIKNKKNGGNHNNN